MRSPLFSYRLEPKRTKQLSSKLPIPERMRANLSPFLSAVLVLLCLGIGCCHKSAPHWVTLTWDASAPAKGVAVKSYNIYRSTTSGGPYAKLASHVVGPPYEDRLVNSGRTYFYVVTALDQSDHESGYSREIKAAIP